MGYVKGDAPDLFISYSRADDQGDADGARPGWVTALSRLLRKEIDRKLGRVGACDIWMDHRLAAGALLDEELDARVRAGAAMLIVLSPGYLGSSWCRREMELFLATDETRRSRVFVIETDRVARPGTLEKVLSIPFWAADRDNPEITEQLGYPRPNEDDPDHKPFFNRLNKLVHAVADTLKEVRAADLPDPDEPRTVGTVKGTIYLARGTDDIDDQYLEVRDYLIQAGYRVVPPGDYPQDEARYVEAADTDLAGSALFVQLLGSLPGRRLGTSSRRHVVAQHDRAVAAGRPILRWRSRSLPLEKVENPEQRARLAEPDVLAMDLEEFKALIVQRIDAILNPPPVTLRPRTQATLNKLIFINADAPDLDHARKLGKVLEQMGAWVSLPYSEETDPEVTPRSYLEEQLGDCDALLLVYGETKGKWVASQLLWSRKPLARRETPASLALVEMPPRPKEPLNVLVPNLQVLRGEPFPSEGDLEQYLRSL